jgi:hypothetical protein
LKGQRIKRRHKRSFCWTLNRNDAVKELNFDRINRIYRMEKRMWHQK